MLHEIAMLTLRHQALHTLTDFYGVSLILLLVGPSQAKLAMG